MAEARVDDAAPIPLHRRWPETERLRRGLLNGYRVVMIRELHGHNRAWLARRMGWAGTAELRAREATWAFWTPEECRALLAAFAVYGDWPLAFFAQDDPPNLFASDMLMCRVGDTPEETVCEVIPGRPDVTPPWRTTSTRRERVRDGLAPRRPRR